MRLQNTRALCVGVGFALDVFISFSVGFFCASSQKWNNVFDRDVLVCATQRKIDEQIVLGTSTICGDVYGNVINAHILRCNRTAAIGHACTKKTLTFYLCGTRMKAHQTMNGQTHAEYYCIHLWVCVCMCVCSRN